jgi:hypothetical protein
MAVIGTITVDFANKTAGLEFRDNGVLISSYLFNSGNLTMSAITNPIEYGIDNFRSAVATADKFVKTVTNILEFPPGRLTLDYERRLEKTPTVLRSRFFITGVKLLDLTWDYETGRATYKPRPSLVVPWSGYLVWLNSIQVVLDQVEHQGLRPAAIAK